MRFDNRVLNELYRVAFRGLLNSSDHVSLRRLPSLAAFVPRGDGSATGRGARGPICPQRPGPWVVADFAARAANSFGVR